MSKNGILLISPPGWALNIGSPYLAFPLLKGYLASKNIPSKILDLNIEAAQYHHTNIGSEEVLDVCRDISLDALNQVWFGAQAKMDRVAGKFNGKWAAQDGFCFEDCDLGSSEDIREFSTLKSPFTEYYKARVLPAISSGGYEAIGFSCVIPSQLLSAFELARLIRESGYDGVLVLGGNTPTRLQKEILLDWVFDIFDVVSFYSGELALEQLWLNLRDRSGWAKIPNIACRVDGNIHSTPVQDLAPGGFAAPDFTGLNVGEYWGVNVLPQVGARGCYYNKCSFCSIPYSWGKNGFIGLTGKSVLRASLLNAVDKHRMHRFTFVDEALHPAVLKNLVEIIDEDSIDIGFEGYGRIEEFWYDDKMLKKLAKTGFKKVFIGLETIDTARRSLLNKGDKPYKALELLKMLNANGIKAHLFVMCGYPGTTVDDSIGTVQFLLEHQDLVDTADVSPFRYAKHTDVQLIEAIREPGRDWSLFQDFKPLADGVLRQPIVDELSKQLEYIVWSEKPEWLHPIYRLFSPWGSVAD